MVAQDRTTVDVDDDQEPDALDLELLLEAQRIAHDDLQAHVQTMAIKLDHLQNLLSSRRMAICRKAFEMGRARQPSAAAEAAQGG